MTSKCKHPDCEPVFQTRGEMKPEDYFGVLDPADLEVEMHEGIRNDCRMACRTCTLATPWSPKEVPNMPGMGEQFIQQSWAKATESKDERLAIFKAIRDQFGDAAIKQHLKHSL